MICNLNPIKSTIFYWLWMVHGWSVYRSSTTGPVAPRLAAARRARDALLADERREKESSQQQRLDRALFAGIGKCPILGLLDITFEWQL